MPLSIEAGAEPIPGYRLLEPLGQGAFSQVWKTEAPGGIFKALKIVQGSLDDDDPHRQLQALAQVKTLRHPYLLSLDRIEIIEGTLLIVGELADRDLGSRLKDCQRQGLPGIPRGELLRYLLEAAEVLDLLNHEHQLQHLNIKPQNLFLMYGHVKVADFGLARDLDGLLMSPTGSVTPAYAAPERFRGELSRSCDQYSLAITYQEMLTGQRPFTGSTAWELSKQHGEAEPDVSPLPVGDRAVVQRALAKDPARRLASCTDLVRILLGELPFAVLAAAPPAAVQPAPPPVEEELPEAIDAEDVPGPEIAEPAAVLTAPPTELHGPGILFPALVIGLGGTGIRVLQELGKELTQRFGGMEALPCIRTLGIDSDRDDARLLAAGPAPEILLAPLNRAAHYYRLKQTRPRPLAWIETKHINSLPRTQQTNGHRLFGRLAFVEHYRGIGKRLTGELARCTAAESLAHAGQTAQLGLLSDRPRVYIVTSLHGGTGSGMFIDLAYLVRQILTGAGYRQAEVIGLFLLPANKEPEAQHLASSLAALIELNHFSSSEVLYTARFDERAESVTDPGAPFVRCLLVPLGNAGGDETDENAVLARAGKLLAAELTTQLSKTAQARRDSQAVAGAKGILFHAAGLHEITWPRAFFLEQAAAELCRRTVAQWLQLTPERRQGAQDWLNDHWASLELDADPCMARLRQQCEKSEGKSIDDIFAALGAACFDNKKTFFQRRALNKSALEMILNEMDYILGRQGAPSLGSKPGKFEKIIDQAAAGLFERWQQNLAERLPRLLESPLRVAGVEEILRLTIERLHKVLQKHRNLYRDLVNHSEQAYDQLRLFVAGVKHAHAPNEQQLEHYVGQYPQQRLHTLLLKGVDQQLGRLADHLANLRAVELGQCRQRLADIARELQIDHAQQAAPAHAIYPGGSRLASDAVPAFCAHVEGQELAKLEQAIEKRLAAQGMSLRQALLSSGFFNLLKATLWKETLRFLEPRVPTDSVVDLHLGLEAAGTQLSQDLTEFVNGAASGLRRESDVAQGETCLIALPTSAGSDRYQELIKGICPAAEFVTLEATDRLLIYREETQLPLDILGYLGSKALKAYASQQGAEGIPPHSRGDLTDWLPLVATWQGRD